MTDSAARRMTKSVESSGQRGRVVLNDEDSGEQKGGGSGVQDGGGGRRMICKDIDRDL